MQVGRNRQGERGSVLAMTTLSMFSLILAAGLAIDISHFYTAKAELQNAADASALAAASQLNSTAGGIKCAVNEATKALNKYDFKTTVTITSAEVTFASNLNGTYVDSLTAQANPAPIRFAKVTLTPRPVNATFSAMVVGSTKNISASATAGLSVGLTMNKFYTAYTFIEPSGSPWVRGQVYTLDAKAVNDSSPNSYRVLNGPLDPGQDPSFISTGQIHAYGTIGASYNIANLNATSPQLNPSAPSMCRSAQIGTNTRFANSLADYAAIHPGANVVDEPPDLITQENITYQQYTDMQGNGVVQASAGVKNRRIMTIPIAFNSSYNTSARTVVAERLAAFFIKKKVGTDCQLQVEFIGAPVAVPEGTYTPGAPQMTELGIPVLYK
jgi:Flp pilus assembly protein TadG